MSNLITGQTKAIQPKSSGYKKANGYFEKYSEKHTSYDAAFAAGVALVTQGYEFTVTPLNGGVYLMEATGEQNFTGGAVNDPNAALTDVWELQPNMVEKDFLDADITLTNGMSADEIAKVKTAVEKTGGVADPAWTASQKKAYALMMAGVKSISIFAPTLRRTRLVRRDYTVRDALTNVGNVIYTASLYTYESVPNTLLFNLPTNSNPTRSDGITLQYGWLKKYPNITQVAGGKWQLVQEWQYNLWATDLYTFI